MSTNLAAENPATKSSIKEQIADLAHNRNVSCLLAIDEATAWHAFYIRKMGLLGNLAPAIEAALKKRGITMHGIQSVNATGSFSDPELKEYTKIKVSLNATSAKAFATKAGAENFAEKVRADLMAITASASVNQFSFRDKKRGIEHAVLIDIWL